MFGFLCLPSKEPASYQAYHQLDGCGVSSRLAVPIGQWSSHLLHNQTRELPPHDPSQQAPQLQFKPEHVSRETFKLHLKTPGDREFTTSFCELVQLIAFQG